MKRQLRNLVTIVMAAKVITLAVVAQTNVLIDEDFQTPMLSNGTAAPASSAALAHSTNHDRAMPSTSSMKRNRSMSYSSIGRR